MEIDLLKIARLAKLSIEPGEAESLRADLDRMVRFAGELQNADLDGLELSLETLPAMDLREDRMEPPLAREDILSGAPESRDGFFFVPKAVETGGGA